MPDAGDIEVTTGVAGSHSSWVRGRAQGWQEGSQGREAGRREGGAVLGEVRGESREA